MVTCTTVVVAIVVVLKTYIGVKYIPSSPPNQNLLNHATMYRQTLFFFVQFFQTKYVLISPWVQLWLEQSGEKRKGGCAKKGGRKEERT